MWTHRLPGGSAVFVGRDKELAMLEAAWRAPRTRVQSLIAWGGAGKTALMRHWLNAVADRGHDGAARVYAWSFYSQGAGEGRQSSADLFIDQMLRWLGDPEPEGGDPWQKGERLATLIRQQKTLLLLDGVEPLQHPPGALFGRLKDPALEVLLKSLADQMDGLCVVSSRFPFPDLEGHGGYAPHDLQRLSAEAGAELLRSRGVKGTEEELQTAAEEYRGHALALRLLGSYLAMYEKGNVHRREVMPTLTEAEDGGAHARRVMQAYEALLDPVERSILHIVGLFDRTAEAAVVAALREPPVIKGLTDGAGVVRAARAIRGKAKGASQDNRLAWPRAVSHLVQLGLLEDTKGDDLDAHPLVREHFGARLREVAPKAWKAAQERLYRHFAAATPDQPSTLEAMEPLFRAMVHGCAAGRYQETMEEVFGRRIQRGDEMYIAKKLGAFAAGLAALAWLFETPWSCPHPSLSRARQGLLLSWAGFHLRALGRLVEAVAPMEAGLARHVQQEDWKSVSGAANNLSEILLALGRIEPAEARAHEAVVHADRSGNLFLRMGTRTAHADAVHQRGQLEEAKALFVEAERIQAEREPAYPVLYSLAGYRFGDLLLSLGQPAEARRRAERTLVWANQGLGLLSIALNHLGCAAANLADFPAAHHLEAAVAGLRKAGTQHFLPRALLVRAGFYRLTTRFDLAHRDLAEAHTIATRGGMRLYICDFHLESARLHLAQGHLDAAREHHATAHAEVHAMGYHRRDPELAELVAALGPASDEQE